ncbi:hypothetical protein [uncultured Hymenobacter sp.]|uniref:hypothetical protein n=1 Tax=uncultured Hymenobacter sp. TaxID=170016 RepID=UPI0035CB40E5
MLLIGSGNVVYKLQLSMPHGRLDQRDFKGLLAYQQTGRTGALAVPSLDQYLSLLYSVGLACPTEAITHTFEDVTFGGISMRTFQVG